MNHLLRAPRIRSQCAVIALDDAEVGSFHRHPEISLLGAQAADALAHFLDLRHADLVDEGTAVAIATVCAEICFSHGLYLERLLCCCCG